MLGISPVRFGCNNYTSRNKNMKNRGSFVAFGCGEKVALRTGHEMEKDLFKSIMQKLRFLRDGVAPDGKSKAKSKSNIKVFQDLATICKNPLDRISSSSIKTLKEYGLLKVSSSYPEVPTEVHQVVEAASEGEGIFVKFVDPLSGKPFK